MFRMTGLLLAIIGVVFVPSSLEARIFQNSQLFDYTDLKSADIQNRQEVERMLKFLQSKPWIVGVNLIELNLDLLSRLNAIVSEVSDETILAIQGASITLVLPSGTLAEFEEISVEKTSSSGLFLSGSHAKLITVYFSLSIEDGRALGNIHVGNEQYFVSPLEGNVHALSRIDVSKFRIEAPPHPHE